MSRLKTRRKVLRWGDRSERKYVFIEEDMSGEDFICGKVKAAVTAMFRWITEEDAWCGLGCKFMRCSNVREAKTPEDAQVRVGRVLLM